MEALMATVVLKRWPWNPPSHSTLTMTDSSGGTFVFDGAHYDWRHFWRRIWVVSFSRSQSPEPTEHFGKCRCARPIVSSRDGSALCGACGLELRNWRGKGGAYNPGPVPPEKSTI